MFNEDNGLAKITPMVSLLRNAEGHFYFHDLCMPEYNSNAVAPALRRPKNVHFNGM